MEQKLWKAYCNTAAPHKGYLPSPVLERFKQVSKTFCGAKSISVGAYIYTYINVHIQWAVRVLPNGCPCVIRIIVTFKWSAYLALRCELWHRELSAGGYKLARRAECGLARRTPCHSRPLGGALLREQRWHASCSAKSCSGTVIIPNYNLD